MNRLEREGDGAFIGPVWFLDYVIALRFFVAQRIGVEPATGPPSEAVASADAGFPGPALDDFFDNPSGILRSRDVD